MKNVHEVEIKLEKEWVDSLDTVFKKKNKEVKIDGFRKGMASKEIYLKHFGIESLYADAIDACISVAYKKALDKEKLIPVIEPQVDVTGISDTNVIFKFTIITKPEVTLGDYKNLKVKKEEAKVTDEEVNNEIEHMRAHMADVVVKEDGTVVEGDTAVISFTGVVDGKEVEGAKGENYPLEIGSHSFIPGFEEGVIGMKTGETKELNLKFPENYVEELKGKDVTFTVTVNEVKTRVLPEINKEFFEDLGYEDVKDEAGLEAKIKEELKDNYEKEYEREYVDELLKEAVSDMECDIDDKIVLAEANGMYEDFIKSLESRGLNEEMYLSFAKTTKDDILEHMKDEALTRLQNTYLIDAIINKENIDITDEESKKELASMAKEYNMMEEDLLNAIGGEEMFKHELKVRKVIDILKSKDKKESK